jgi:hypothetical protein
MSEDAVNEGSLTYTGFGVEQAQPFFCFGIVGIDLQDLPVMGTCPPRKFHLFVEFGELQAHDRISGVDFECLLKVLDGLAPERYHARQGPRQKRVIPVGVRLHFYRLPQP